MRITLVFLVLISFSNVFSQKEFVDISDRSKKAVQSFIKQNGPKIYLLNGVVYKNQDDAEIIYADLNSLDLINKLDLQKFKGKTIIIKSKRTDKLLEEVIKLVNTYSNRFLHIHLIIEEGCLEENCFSSNVREEVLGLIHQESILISFEEETIQ